MPLDIMDGINDSTISVTYQPSDITSPEKIFDGNHLTNSITQNSDSLVVTLFFDIPVEISRSKVYFWHGGKWNLEVADSESDLNDKAGSYQLLIDNSNFPSFGWDSVSIAEEPVEAQFVRLRAYNPGGSSIYLGEWSLYHRTTFTALHILPDPLSMVPGTSFELDVELVADNGSTHPYTLADVVSWASDNTAVVTVGELGTVYAHSIGSARITASTTALAGTTTVNVVEDFQLPNAETLTIKVALVLQDPVIDFVNNERIHEKWGWANPVGMANQLVEEFSQASHGVVQFQIVQTYDDTTIFSRLDGQLMRVENLAYFYSSSVLIDSLKRLTEQEGRVKFDYIELIDHYRLDSLRNTGVIDEVWVYAHPFAGMWESQLVGPGAFWWNSSPLDHPGLEKLLSIMGWNYER
ncbi:MAG: Ig-like domain-containing protein, partial [Candidatus Marinimicrobia bacterium]|nr:Ig-like domain-containing protein [Candidatus Neomarinimicrobiota bacterium]